MNKRMTVSELIDVLSKMQSKYGDLEITVNTPDGGIYSLYSKENIHLVRYYDEYCNKVISQTIEIGELSKK